MNNHRKKTKEEIKNEKHPLEESFSETEKKDSKNKGKTKKNDIEKQLNELNEKYLRLFAEYDNYRKRSVREIEIMYQTATEDFIKDILPIMDNLDRTAEHKNDNTTLEEYVKGITLIEDQLRDILTKAGLKHIEVVGKSFDPNIHDAVMQIESEEYESGIIVTEVQKGYMVGDKIIRHSKVVVSK